jgi:ArsR family transcriptional regulator
VGRPDHGPDSIKLAASRCRRRIAALNDIIKLNMSAREVQIDDRQLLLISKALADPKRFEMLQKIGQSKDAPTCSCVRDGTGLAPATVSHHLKELDNAGLIHVERSGKFAHITLRRDVWNAYLRRLSAL